MDNKFLFVDNPPRMRAVYWFIILSLDGAILYMHSLVGLSFEFHAFLSIPVLMATWMLGRSEGFATAIITNASWLGIDWALDDTYVAHNILIFNTLMRLTIALVSVWMIAELRLSLIKLKDLAEKDPMTNLYNRLGFLSRGESAFELNKRQEKPFTAIYIDLDHFKEVNDAYGHQTGDELLRRISNCLQINSRRSDIQGRLGGDEFAILLPEMNPEVAKSYIEKLREELLAAMQQDGWPVTFSIGVASQPRAEGKLEGLLDQADQLMYKVKSGGRNSVQYSEVNSTS